MMTATLALRRLTIQNLLSFGNKATTLELGSLNVVIGPNGSGKSNLIEVIGLLQSAPKELGQAVTNGGGIDEWLWKGAPETPVASIEAILEPTHRGEGALKNGPPMRRGSGPRLRYKLSFSKEGYKFGITDEVIENELAAKGEPSPYFFFRYVNGTPTLNLKESGRRSLQREEINGQVSVLAQRKDPEHYPEITRVGRVFGQFRLYRDWEFGGLASVREPCDVSLPNDFLEEDGSNLGVVVDRLLSRPPIKREIIDSLKLFYEGVTDLRTSVDAGKMQTRLEEKYLNSAIPLARLSDGTVRWLSLLSILLNPDPPPLVCIEEPELGFHPDMIQELAKLLVGASQRSQVIVTTHSDKLLEFLSEQPESVIVCEKHSGATCMQRLDKEQLAGWLDRYSLGELWRKGEIGGNRW